MRFVLALLAIIGLLASPAAAAAAQAACHENGGPAIMSMPAGDMPGASQADAHEGPACRHPGAQGQTKRHMSCLQACAAMCGVVATLPAAPIALVRAQAQDAPTPAPVVSLKSHDPTRLERPPRSIA
jgi:hypothetical protein